MLMAAATVSTAHDNLIIKKQTNKQTNQTTTHKSVNAAVDPRSDIWVNGNVSLRRTSRTIAIYSAHPYHCGEAKMRSVGAVAGNRHLESLASGQRTSSASENMP